MDRWVGKVAVVTGASSGIGAAIAKSLADRGIIVVGIARRRENIQKLGLTTNGIIHARRCDMSDETQIIDVFKWVNAALGGVDILINNAGVSRVASLINGRTEDWRTMLNINVLALSIATREALVSMRQKENGHIININSVTGHRVPQMVGIPVGMYSASKHAVTALTQALRIELSEQKNAIRVTSISPGSVYTQMVRDLAKALSGGAETSSGQTAAVATDEPDAPATAGTTDPPYGFMNEIDVVDAVLYALEARPNVQVHDVLVQATGDI